ncbi:MAG: hypothetical protein HYS07_10515 [Chlamydiae bacterium]|nr:hypothetical protein [Chlamydiota bacterium]
MASFLNAESEKDKLEERGTQGEILVRFKVGVSEEKIQSVFDQYKLTVIEKYSLVENLFLCHTREGQDVHQLIDVLNQNSEIEYAESNQKVEALDVES